LTTANVDLDSVAVLIFAPVVVDVTAVASAVTFGIDFNSPITIDSIRRKLAEVGLPTMRGEHAIDGGGFTVDFFCVETSLNLRQLRSEYISGGCNIAILRIFLLFLILYLVLTVRISIALIHLLVSVLIRLYLATTLFFTGRLVGFKFLLGCQFPPELL
jgi:hypothetical protein